MANLAAAAFSCGLLLIAATSSMAFPTGAPVIACSTLTPQHTSPTPCGPNCPFSLALTAVDGNAPQTTMRYRCGSLHTSKMNLDRQVHDCVHSIQIHSFRALAMGFKELLFSRISQYKCVHFVHEIRSSTYLPVTPAQLMRPGIGRNVSCTEGDFA